MLHVSRQQIYKYICILCGFLIIVIDWTRGSQVGTTWAWTVNMLGLVFGMLILCQESAPKTNWTYGVIFTILLPLCIFLGYRWWLGHQTVVYRDQFLSAIFNVWFILFILINRVTNEGVKNSWNHIENKRLFIGLLGFLLLALLSRNEDIWMLWIGAWLTLWYSTEIKESDKQTIIDGITSGIILGFVALQLFALMLRPFDNEMVRYCGMYANVNINALFYVVTIAAIMWKRIQAKGTRKIILEILTIILYCLLILTVSKTAWITLFVIEVLFWGLVRIHLMQETAIQTLRRSFGTLLVTAIVFPVVFMGIRYLPTILHHPIWYEGEYSEERVHSFDPANSEKYIELDEFLEGFGEKIGPYVDRIFHSKVKAAELDENIEQTYGITVGDKFYSYNDPETWKYASVLGRLGMWQYYLKNGTLLGHSNADGHNFVIWVYTWHAQNLFVQVWYYYGIIAAVVMTILLVSLLVYVTRLAWRKNKSAIFVLIVFTTFIVFGMFEAVWYPGQAVLSLVFITPKLIGNEKISEK